MDLFCEEINTHTQLYEDKTKITRTYFQVTHLTGNGQCTASASEKANNQSGLFKM